MKRKAFTLIELLVVIAIIALLLAILLPALNKVKDVARAVVCRAHLHQWGLITALYAEDNESRLYQSAPGGNISGEDAYWIGASLPYYHEKKIRTCPSTKPIEGLKPYWENLGSTFEQWGPIQHEPGPNNIDDWAESFANGSYGNNGWAACPPGTTGNYWQEPVANAWRKTTVSGAFNIPVFADAAYLEGFVKTGDTPDPLPEDQRTPEKTTGRWRNNSIRLFAINRHNESVNVVFLDASASKVPLKQLWRLKWHKNYAATMPAWPAWMQSMKD
jgi:prepilin-type N-terminal cleavage/methylation domain-containing protein/prepilin-type processing-associated H-X9-DG protein